LWAASERTLALESCCRTSISTETMSGFAVASNSRSSLAALARLLSDVSVLTITMSCGTRSVGFGLAWRLKMIPADAGRTSAAGTIKARRKRQDLMRKLHPWGLKGSCRPQPQWLGSHVRHEDRSAVQLIRAPKNQRAA